LAHRRRSAAGGRVRVLDVDQIERERVPPSSRRWS
jgi:hypothetical protein